MWRPRPIPLLQRLNNEVLLPLKLTGDIPWALPNKNIAMEYADSNFFNSRH